MAKTKQNKTKIIQRCFLVLEDNKTLEANQCVDYKSFLTVDVMYQNEHFTVVQRSVWCQMLVRKWAILLF